MKFFWLSCLLLVSQISLADSNIISIDNEELPYSFEEASERALPYQELQSLLETDQYTPLSRSQMSELFNKLMKDKNARNSYAGGRCNQRRIYIQNYLSKKNITSGELYINCPGNIGHMSLIDQATGHRYTFSNFHDANVVSGPDGYYVMDVQFENEAMSLISYLAQIEASQKLKPAKERSWRDRGFCYWGIY